MDEELRRELLARRDEDQRIRTLVPRGWGQCTAMPAEVAAQWQRIDEDNTRWLADVVSGRGGRWPVRTAPRRRGCWPSTRTADPARQQAFLNALRGAAGQGEASLSQLAYLEDRVRVNAGQPQRYGTQFIETDGAFGPQPIEDLQRLDERRAEAGLEPFADYEARMRALS